MSIVADIFEILMILAFGFSWPFNIVRAYNARTTKGTSLLFLCLIGSGYVAGILCKIFACQGVVGYWTPTKILAFIFYFINLSLIITALIVYCRNKKIDSEKNK